MFAVRCLLYLLILGVTNTAAQAAITTVAGTDWKLTGVGGPAADARLGSINGVAVDARGNVYAADGTHCTVVGVSPAGILTVVAGNGQCGSSLVSDGAPATSGSLKVAGRLAIDAAGNVYVAGDNRVRKVTPSGIISTSTAAGNTVADVAADSSGNLYIIMGMLVRRVSRDGTVSTLYEGEFKLQGDCWGIKCHYWYAVTTPTAVAVDATDKIYIAVSSNFQSNGVFRINLDGTRTSVVSGFRVRALTADRAGNVFIAEANSQRILKADPNGGVSPVGSVPSAAAELPDDSVTLAADAAGNIYLTAQRRLWRMRQDGSMSTVAGAGQLRFSGDGGPATQAALYGPNALAFDGTGNLYIADAMNHRIRKLDANGIITTVAGNGQYGSSGDGGPATKASLALGQDAASSWPWMAVAADGTIYIIEAASNYINARIRRIGPDGIITTVAGQALGYDCAPEGARALVAAISPSSIALDSSGKLHFVDTVCRSSVRTIDAYGSLRTVRAGDPEGPENKWLRFDDTGNLYLGGRYRICRVDKDGTCRVILDTFRAPMIGSISGFAVDRAGNILVAEDWYGTPRIISILLGGDPVIFQGSGQTGTRQTLAPLAPDTKGNVYVADSTENSVWRIPAVPDYVGLPEPEMGVNLQPGFYVAQVTLGQGQRGGYWSMEVSPAAGLAGGLIAGGGIQGSTQPPGWAAFSLARPATVRVQLVAQVLPGGDPAAFSMAVRLLDSGRKQIGTDQLGTSSLQFERALSEGFYIVEVRGGASAPRAVFELGISAESLAGPAYAGGFIAPNLPGFVAFSLPQPQEVKIKASGAPANGPEGAGSLLLRLLGASRDLIQSVP